MVAQRGPMVAVVVGVALVVSGAQAVGQVLPWTARAQSGGGYDLTWSTADSSGGSSAGGEFELSGSAGQPDAGIAVGVGGYVGAGGYWIGSGLVRADCNLDFHVNAGDLSAVVLEIFDGDGTLAADTPGATFLGSPDGCDANGDDTVSAADLSCIVLRIFNGPGSCGPS